MQPFNLSHQAEFEHWARFKLSLYVAARIKQQMCPVVINSDGRLLPSQLTEILSNIACYNFATYRVEDKGDFNTESLSRLGQSLGLKNLDDNLCAEEDLVSVISDSSAHVTAGNPKQRYIPYTNKALSWHTDGYYNPYHQRVQAFILHCQQPADHGGENSLIDPDLIYLALRRSNPEFIDVLSRNDVMRIPENRQGDTCLREETASPVFLTSDNNSRLAMRFSQRKRHIIWRDDALTQDALGKLNELLDNDSDWHINVRLKAGEGIISNNVLHCRKAYQDRDGHRRVFLRARYYNAIPKRLVRGDNAISQ